MEDGNHANPNADSSGAGQNVAGDPGSVGARQAHCSTGRGGTGDEVGGTRSPGEQFNPWHGHRFGSAGSSGIATGSGAVWLITEERTDWLGAWLQPPA
jgi:hypothetical protein